MSNTKPDTLKPLRETVEAANRNMLLPPAAKLFAAATLAALERVHAELGETRRELEAMRERLACGGCVAMPPLPPVIDPDDNPERGA